MQELLDDEQAPFPVLKIDPIQFSQICLFEEHFSMAAAVVTAAGGKDHGKDLISRIGG
jgi:hypothetical protein